MLESVGEYIFVLIDSSEACGSFALTSLSLGCILISLIVLQKTATANNLFDHATQSVHLELVVKEFKQQVFSMVR